MRREKFCKRWKKIYNTMTKQEVIDAIKVLSVLVVSRDAYGPPLSGSATKAVEEKILELIKLL